MRKVATSVAFVSVFLAQAQAGSASDATAQLDAAEAQWKRNGPAVYEFSFRYRAMFRYVECEGGFRAKVASDVTVEPSGCNQLRSIFATVPALFAYIRQELLKAPEDVQVTFDPRYGYPVTFDIDYRKNVYDDEFRFSVEGFRQLD